jgi:hypothetical protein
MTLILPVSCLCYRSDSVQEKLDSVALSEVNRLMYGGTVPDTLPEASDVAKSKAEEHDFQILSFSIAARQEQLRQPRVTRIGLIQNQWPSSPSSPVQDQLKSIQERMAQIVAVAGEMGVQVWIPINLRCPGWVLSRVHPDPRKPYTLR